MMRKLLATLTLAAGWCLLPRAEARLGNPPDWVQAIAKQPTPPDVGNAPSVVLMCDELQDVDAQGGAVRRRRFAIRVLQTSGRYAAVARVDYLQKAQKVQIATAWLLRNGREVRYSDRADWADVSTDGYGTLRGDFRAKMMSFDDAVPGDVFVAETEVAYSLLTADTSYRWGWGELPIVRESFRLRVPRGFTLKPLLKGTRLPTVTTTPDGLETRWTVEASPYSPSEDGAPDSDPACATLMLQIQPPPGSKSFRATAITNWRELGVWLTTLNSAQCDQSPALVDATQRLVAKCATTAEKISALGAYVQNLRYIAVNEGIARGLGYQPRKASQVFTYGYGDCKDKANLLCAMLREIGVEAYIAAARVSRDTLADPDFPSAAQFDHAICAIRVGEDIQLPAVVNTSTWGRLLFFDPTSEHTPLGDLPLPLQGSLVYVQRPESNQLIELPRMSPRDGHAYTRRAVVTVADDGSCSAKVSFSGVGQAGATMREYLFNLTNPDNLRRAASRLLSDAMRGAHLSNVATTDTPDRTRCSVDFEFAAGNYVQNFKNSMAVAKADVLSRAGLPVLSAPTRRAPVKVYPIAFDDEVEIVLPASLELGEIPSAVSLSTPYGSYSRAFVAQGKSIKMTRKLELNSLLVPAADYAQLKKFLGEISKADRASLLLRRGA